MKGTNHTYSLYLTDSYSFQSGSNDSISIIWELFSKAQSELPETAATQPHNSPLWWSYRLTSLSPNSIWPTQTVSFFCHLWLHLGFKTWTLCPVTAKPVARRKPTEVLLCANESRVKGGPADSSNHTDPHKRNAVTRAAKGKHGVFLAHTTSSDSVRPDSVD